MKKTFLEFLTEKGIDELSALEVEKQGELYTEYISNITKSLAEAVEGNATKEEFEEMRKDIVKAAADNAEVTNNILKTQGKAIKEALNKLSSNESIEKTIEEHLTENKESISKYKNGEQVAFKFTTKAVADMTAALNVSGGDLPQSMRIPGLNTVPSRQVRFLDVLTKGAVSSNIVDWVYQSGKEGAAGQTAQGSTKNQIDFNMVVASQKVEKTTAYITITDEMLDDIPFMATEINNELMREMAKAIESGAFNGNGTTPNLSGVDTVATAFAAGTFALGVDNANEVDVLVVAANQIAIANQDAPNYIFMHPSDVTSLKLEKVTATDKRYVQRLQEDGGSLSMDGIPIIQTTLVAVGDYLIGDFTKANLLTKQGVTIEVGYNADNFVKNFKTIRAEWRGVCYVKNNDRTAFVTGTFSADMAALETT